MDRFALATCTTGLPGWMTMALESVEIRQNATCSQMGDLSLRAMTGDERATSMFGTQWVRNKFTCMFVCAQDTKGKHNLKQPPFVSSLCPRPVL